MKKILIPLSVSLLSISAVTTYAAPLRNDLNNEILNSESQNNSKNEVLRSGLVILEDGYVHGQVIIEIIDNNTGKIVNTEYFDVKLSPEEFEQSGYVPIMPLSTLAPFEAHIVSGNSTNWGLIATVSHNGIVENRSFNYLSGNIQEITMSLRTITLGNVIGKATLNPGQSARFTVPFGTLSYDITVFSSGNSANHSGTGRFSLTR